MRLRRALAPCCRNRQEHILSLPLKHKGAHAELVATAWLLEQGYEVFRNVSQDAP